MLPRVCMLSRTILGQRVVPTGINSWQASRRLSIFSKFKRGTTELENTPAEIVAPIEEIDDIKARDPQFELIGTTPSLLQAEIPPSSSIFTRNGSIVGVRGRFSDVTTKLDLAGPLTRYMSVSPVLYQRTTSVSLVKLILSGMSRPFFSIQSVNPSTIWVATSRQSVFGWNSSLVTVRPSDAVFKGAIEVSGKGQVVFSSSVPLHKIEIERGQSMSVLPSNLIAYSQEKEGPSASIVKIPHSTLRLDLPTIASSDSSPSWWAKAKKASSSLFTNSWKNDTLVEFHGPSTLLVGQTYALPAKSISLNAIKGQLSNS